MTTGLKKKTALVTGANSGIGFEVAKILLANQFKVVGHYHHESAALGTLAQQDLELIQSDFSSTTDLTKFCRSLAERDIDVVINNAATYVARDSLLDISPESFQNTFCVNVIAPLRVMQTLIPPMLEREWGRIINVSSISASHGGSSTSLDYTSSKVALETITTTLARECAPRNVLLNSLRPGVTDTSMHARNPGKDLRARTAQIPLRRMGSPTEIAKVIAFLASEEASFISGAIIPVSGGE